MANTKTIAAVVGLSIVVGAAGVTALRRSRPRDPDADDGRWRVVTVGVTEDRLHPLPAPLAEFTDLIEVRTSPAPGGRGIELAARPSPANHPDGQVLAGLIRRALRESKQVLEAGEIATNEPQPEGHRPATPAGLLTDAVARRSPEEGVL